MVKGVGGRVSSVLLDLAPGGDKFVDYTNPYKCNYSSF